MNSSPPSSPAAPEPAAFFAWLEQAQLWPYDNAARGPDQSKAPIPATATPLNDGTLLVETRDPPLRGRLHPTHARPTSGLLVVERIVPPAPVR